MQHQSCPIILMDTNLHFYQTHPDLGHITMQTELNLTSKEMLGKQKKDKSTACMPLHSKFSFEMDGNV